MVMLLTTDISDYSCSEELFCSKSLAIEGVLLNVEILCGFTP
jgi:hypothetical protein